jgi:hypothetical protein
MGLLSRLLIEAKAFHRTFSEAGVETTAIIELLSNRGLRRKGG